MRIIRCAQNVKFRSSSQSRNPSIPSACGGLNELSRAVVSSGPQKFEMINLKTTKALGIVPLPLLATADEVIVKRREFITLLGNPNQRLDQKSPTVCLTVNVVSPR